MCGRYRLVEDDIEIVKRVFPADDMDWVERPRWNVAPSQVMPVLGVLGHRRVLFLARWGFVPTFEKAAKPRARPINARAETVESSGFFRAAFRHGRCVVPADGFYEWKTTAAGKRPHLFTRPDGGLYGFAGLWSRWSSPSGPEVTFCILTTDANATVAPVHDRMPVVLPDEAARAAWLTGSVEEARALLRPAPDDFFVRREVSAAVGSVHNDGPECEAPPEPAPDPPTDAGPGPLFRALARGGGEE